MSDSAPRYADCYQILGFAIVFSALSEALSWLLIYRREDYKRLTASVDKSVCTAAAAPALGSRYCA